MQPGYSEIEQARTRVIRAAHRAVRAVEGPPNEEIIPPGATAQLYRAVHALSVLESSSALRHEAELSPDFRAGRWHRLHTTAHIRRGDELWLLSPGPPQIIWRALSDGRSIWDEELRATVTALTISSSLDVTGEPKSTEIRLPIGGITVFRPDVTAQGAST